MKILKTVILFLLICPAIFAQSYDLDYGGIDEHIYGGVPSDGKIRERIAYVVEFDETLHIPLWVAYHVIPEYTETPTREGKWQTYRNDPSTDFDADKYDYQYDNQYSDELRNFAKGHLAPYFISGGDRDDDGLYATDITNPDDLDILDEDDKQTVYEINYYTNLVPQHQNNFNGSGGLWYDLETFNRDELLKKHGKELWVYAGCVIGKANYDTLGDDLTVPPMFFKIVIMEVDSSPKVVAFLFPHQSERHGEMSDYLVSIDTIEALTGLNFFWDLDINESELWEMERKQTTETWNEYYLPYND